MPTPLLERLTPLLAELATLPADDPAWVAVRRAHLDGPALTDHQRNGAYRAYTQRIIGRATTDLRRQYSATWSRLLAGARVEHPDLSSAAQRARAETALRNLFDDDYVKALARQRTADPWIPARKPGDVAASLPSPPGEA